MSKPYFKQSAEQYNAALPQYQRDFASGQVLAGMASSLQKVIKNKGTFQDDYSLLEPNGSWKNYSAYTIEGLIKGMHGFIFMPQQTQHHQPEQIKIAFRGTHLDSSLLHDFDPFGPGLTAFRLSEQTLLEQLNEVVVGKNNVELTIAGHSLGGSHATYLLISILEEHNSSGKYNAITKITLDTYNAPSAYKGYYENAQDILKTNADSKHPIELHVNIGVADNDAIQHIGHNIFDQLDPFCAKVQMVKSDTIPTFNDPLSALGGELLGNFLEGFEYYLSHTLEGNYFGPSQPHGKINTDLEHEYWNNRDANGKAHIDYQLESSGPVLTTGILDALLLPGKIVREAALKFEKQMTEALDDVTLEFETKMSASIDDVLNFDDLFSDVINEFDLDELFSDANEDTTATNAGKGTKEKAATADTEVYTMATQCSMKNPVPVENQNPDIY